MLFFVFKQKTAYEMSISDWSSDVCSSDLEVDEAIRAAMPRAGAIDRMEAILRYALRCATYEILARIDVPATTVIDEYTGIVRAFFGPREIKLANGVIDALAPRLLPGESAASPTARGRGV